MAYPGTMTPEQQSSQEVWMEKTIRPLAGELARVLNHCATAWTEYNGAQNNSNGTMSCLENADELPVANSGLDGAEPIAKSDVLTFLTMISTLLSGYNQSPERGLYAKLSGEVNLNG